MGWYQTRFGREGTAARIRETLFFVWEEAIEGSYSITTDVFRRG